MYRELRSRMYGPWMSGECERRSRESRAAAAKAKTR